jgi:zinc finger SWIM domain-containing protein 3
MKIFTPFIIKLGQNLKLFIMQLHDKFESVAAARNAIKAYVLDQGESYKTVASDKKRFIIKCKSDGCGFRVCATKHANETSSIAVFDPHTCSPVTYYKSKQSQSVAYLAPHHKASVIDNRNITVAQIRSNERLQHGNNVSYKQAYRTVQTLRKEIEGCEAEGFAKFPAYVQAFLDADVDNYCELKTTEDGKFEAAFFAPCGMRCAHLYMRRFIGFDGTHTRSRYRIMLLICARIDANDQVLPLA